MGLSANVANAQNTIIDSGDCGASGNNLTWVLTSDSVLTISGSGAMANYDYYYDVPWNSNRYKIKTLVIGSSVTTIGNFTFTFCSELSGTLTIPNLVTTIGYGAFEHCSGLTSVTIGDSVTTIGDLAFSRCSGLSGALTIPNSVTTIGHGAFVYCSGLSGTLTIPNSVTTIKGLAFSYCSGLNGALIIPNSVMTIGNGAFYRCYGLTSVTIGNSVTTIGDYAFAACSGLSGALTIPNSVITIGERAFMGCSGLNGALTIGNSVTTIGSGAFYNCIGLTSVTCKTIVPISLNSNVFTNVPNGIPVYVPCYSLNAYQASWTYFNNFQALQIDTVTINAVICNGTTYSANGFNETTAGEYSRSEQNSDCGDIIIVLNLSVYAIVDTTFINASIMEGETYIDNGFNESTAGTYKLTLQNVNGCDSVIVLNLSVNGNGLTDIEATDFSIYTNPAKDKLFIEDEGFDRIIVYDVLGKEVLASNKKEVDISSLPNGVYNVRILQNGKTVATKKVVKQ